ncbi:MAG: circadian clock protein KaiC, partial [Acidobacteriota bacterium]|nr:circadian clock protein KaiC [Acidobacteriota bacterium]
MTDENIVVGELKSKLVPDRLKDGIDYEFLEHILSIAIKCFANPRYEEVYRLHNKWYKHVNNILEFIGKFCDKARFQLKEHEGNILIAAAILHDIGKSLHIMHPDIRAGKFKDNATVLDALENSHHVISFLFIRSLFDYKNRDKVIEIFEKEDLFKTVLNKMQADFPLTSTASSIIVKPKWMEYLQCAAWMALRHKQLKEKHLHIFKSELKDYLKKDSKPVDDETYEKDALTFFGKETTANPEIKEVNEFLNANQETDDPDRFSILSALLQLGDKLDISRKRLQMSYFYLEVLLDDITDREVLRDNLLHPQSMTRWFQFYYTGEPKIESIPKDANSKNTEEQGVKIIIPYFYPESIRKDFLYFRYKAEKDFEELGIIYTLERALRIAKNNNEDFRIIIERTENKKNGNPLRIIGLESRKERLTYCLRKICEECLKTGEKELKFDDVSEKINKVLEKTVKTFSCTSSTGLDPSKKCPLAEEVMSIFEKDTCQASYPGWEKYSFMLRANRYGVLCRKSINPAFDYDRRKECLRELKGKRIRLSLSRQAREGVKLWKEDAVKDRNKLPSGTIFYPHESRARFIPVSLDIAYLLNLFRHLRGESLTIDDIVAISGLDRGRILKYCGWLEHEKYLLLDDKAETYKINLEPANYSIVEKVLKEFDFQRSEMVSKIRDIDRFGKPLALYSELNNERIKTNIKGLDQILCPFEKENMWGLPLRKSLLLVGPPGSGKTTLALDIIRQVRLQRLPEEIALYLTFSGDIQRLADDFKPLGWEYQDIAACVRSLSTLQGKTYLNDPDKFFKHLLNILDEFSPDLVAIDNLGYFLRLVPPEFCREIFNRLIKVLTVRGITSILIGDGIPNGIGFESFDSDGVICLHYKDGKRELEITKMRGREFAGGRHPFKIKGISEEDRGKPEELDKPIIEVFPNIQMHLEVAHRKKKEEDRKKEEEKQALKSGIKGLDELLPIVIEGKKDTGFEQGENILVLGSP